MLTILHAADFHLDAPFDGLTPEQAANRREEQRQLLGKLAELQQDCRADVVLLPGDLFDRGDASQETGEAVRKALCAMNAPVIIAPGNHDYLAARSPYRSLVWSNNVHIFTGEAMEQVELQGLDCVVHGCAFTSPYRDDDPLRGFMAPRDGKIHLGVLHGDVGAKSRYAPIDEASIAVSGLHYLALGHVHAASPLQKTGDTSWAYSGCLQGRGFDELGEKGALVVTLEGDRRQARFVPLPARRYEILSVDVSQGDPLAALAAALPEDAQEDIYRILLTGESDVAGLDLAPLRALAEPRFYSVSLRDTTVVRHDIWQRAQEETLTGCFLREMKGRLEKASESEAETLFRAVRFGLAALERREVPR